LLFEEVHSPVNFLKDTIDMNRPTDEGLFKDWTGKDNHKDKD